jgi:hypothetical protein
MLRSEPESDVRVIELVPMTLTVPTALVSGLWEASCVQRAAGWLTVARAGQAREPEIESAKRRASLFVTDMRGRRFTEVSKPFVIVLTT